MLIDHGELLAWLTGYTVSETRYRACLVPLQDEPK
jgi:Xaa-Pro dipeptidase